MTWLEKSKIEAKSIVFAILVGVLGWFFLRGMVARAQDVPLIGGPSEFEQLAALALRAIESGDGWGIAAALLCVAVFVIRYVAKRWLKDGPARRALLSDPGGVLLTLAAALFAGLAHVRLAGGVVGLAFVGTALKVAVAAMGGFVGVKKTVKPLVAWLERKYAPHPPPEPGAPS